MVKIKGTQLDKFKDHWDYQRAKLLLEADGLSGDVLTREQRNGMEKAVTEFLWSECKRQFPNIEKFCTSRRGGFNKIESRNFNTPIINIHGSFYIQLIIHNNDKTWEWEAIELEPYRFCFNEEGYLRGLIVDAANKILVNGRSQKEQFGNLIGALNEKPVTQSEILINTKNATVDLVKRTTVIV